MEKLTVKLGELFVLNDFPCSLQSDYSAIERELTKFGSRVLYKLGLGPISSEFPVLDALKVTGYISMFMVEFFVPSTGFSVSE